MRFKTLLLSLLVISSMTAQNAVAKEGCDIEEPVELYKFQDEILALPKKVSSVEELQEKIKAPLKCLLQNYTDSENLLVKYVAGACLQRLMGAAEIKGFFKRTKNYDVITEAILNQQLSNPNPLQKSEIADLASGKWSDYVTFCKGIKDSLCGEFLPTNERIKDQNELLGATSMLLLKSALGAFKGSARQKVAEQILQLGKETPKNSSLKRKVIDQIIQEMNQSDIKLRGS